MTERLQPLQNPLKRSAVPHQHKRVDVNVAMVITILICSRRQDSMLPTTPLQDHNLVSTIAATGVFEARPDKEPPMTRKKLLSRNHRQSLIEALRQDKIKEAGLCSRVASKRKREVGHADAAAAGNLCDVS